MREGLHEFGPGNMTLSIYTYKSGILSTLGYDLFIKATDFKMSMEIKGENAKENKIGLEVNADSLKVASLMMTESTDNNILTEGHKNEIDSNIKGSNVLNVKKYPKITFISKKIFEEADCFKVTGDLTIRDKTKEIEMVLKKDIEKPDTKFSGSFDLYQTKFGIRPYSAMFGTLCVKDKIEIKWEFGTPA
ncbi:MAG: YceI family protein [bacterium]|nr:YceI family protein [bacterium]